MKVTLIGNTSKTNKKFFPATDTKPARFHFGVADSEVKKRVQQADDNTKEPDAVWYNCVASYEYAPVVQKLLGGDEAISRNVLIEGRITKAPKIRYDEKTKQTFADVTVWVDNLICLDKKNKSTQPAPADDDDIDVDDIPEPLHRTPAAEAPLPGFTAVNSDELPFD